MKRRQQSELSPRYADELVKSAERLSAKIDRDIAALEAEERRRNKELFSFALGLFLGASLFGGDGD